VEEVKKQYQVTIKNKFAALENLDDNGDIYRAWETIREIIRISAKESIGLCESKSYKPLFNELLNIQGPGGIRQTEIHTAEPFVPEPSVAEVEVTIRKMTKYKAPGSDQIPAELIQAVGGGNIMF
jgi:hypothetical protein